ncbi:MAG: alkyl hydroperoxide reductase [Pirellula sp.]|nr:alkyl hydroperoxide reductase [Pirellula sp.]
MKISTQMIAAALCVVGLVVPAPAAAPSSNTAADVSSKAVSASPTEVQAGDDDEATLREGHSYHGEAFNEGPRQAAYLMPGMGNVSFPVTTKNAEAQKFFNQGVAQLHGFWYFEAERSFRQAAALDPDCAMAYWGMCQANTNNAKRAEKFIAEAVKRREQASPRERLWIDAWAAYHKPDPKPEAKAEPAAKTEPAAKPDAAAKADAKTDTKAVAKPATPPTPAAASTKPNPTRDKDRRQALIKALENIVQEHPEDIEAKAHLVLFIWQSRGPLPIVSYQAVDALIDQVLEKNPMHPIHHYRIHLWDDQKAVRALGSAALGGQSTPGIAHMWHMPGHTFSKLQRFDDAAWQQEAASRTDHAYMMRDRVLPDQIHNYAHNHEWLIRDLSNIGRVRYGVELAKNLIEMPRHPKYNVLTKNGSAQYGRTRLVELLQRFELYDDLLALVGTPYLEMPELPRDKAKHLRVLGVAALEAGNSEAGLRYQKELETLLAKEQKAQKEAGDKAEAAAKQKKEPKEKVAKARNDALNPFRAQISQLEAALADVRARSLVAEKKYADALAQLKKAGITGGEYLSRVTLLSGNQKEAERLARAVYGASAKQVVPTANLTYVLWKCGKQAEAEKTFAELRTLAGAADLDVPVFERLQPLAAQLKFPADWRTPPATRTDVGARPALDTLGPIRWEPSLAPSFTIVDADGASHALGEYRGRNVIFIFYLGFGCLHCVDQLKAVQPLTEEFKKAGIEIVAVSTDKPADLKSALTALKPADHYAFTILSGGDLTSFQALRAYDDFEAQPLHATALVDAAGRLRWIDIGAEPFTDVKFLLAESKRLLQLSQAAPSSTNSVQGHAE